MSDALDAVVDAALERALVDEADARRYFALAGVLERAHGRDEIDGDPPDETTPRGDTSQYENPFDAALVSTVAIRALDATRSDGIDVGAWSPGTDATHAEFVRIGAVAAARRFDVDIEVVAARSGVSRQALARYRATQSTDRS
ncbi:hypothetical protein D3D02_12610 [Halobellus sp. Atlit-38R]|uniref:hypothetical protein n=1 Tax=Halobellus sp. Atlit-38R TaxID=2282131 RepID=UPI000EF23FD6|nr:hypothetical protein [Halobellus sp. Atlit-38R]RLM88405.1 hypothetical protein D3D02_12610 [Halobellus sp. Atlit-38R]